MIKKIYKKTIELAAHKKSKFFLAIISFIESFIFPIPPDVIIIPMTIAKKNDWFKIALVATTSNGLYRDFLNCCPEADLNLLENLSRCCRRIRRPD